MPTALQHLTDLLMTILWPALLVLGGWLATKIVKVVETKTGISLTEHQEEMLRTWTVGGIRYAEEFAHKASKAAAKVTGPEKLELAADYVFSAVERAGWDTVARDKIKAMVEARINATRPAPPRAPALKPVA